MSNPAQCYECKLSYAAQLHSNTGQNSYHVPIKKEHSFVRSKSKR